MTKLKNSAQILMLLLALMASSCKREVPSKTKESKGYLESSAFKNDLENRKDYKYNSEYSTKRMFLLLGEEGFLYNSNYKFYAVFYYVKKGTCEFYIIKSKDSLQTYSYKRIDTGDAIFYVDKLNGDKSDKKIFNIDVKTRLLEKHQFQSATDLFNKVVPLTSIKQKFYPPYDTPIRGVFLFYKNEFYLISDSN
ncbi:MAG: hypothetical protein EOO44_20145, partial [Flavobacterium sp.]